MHRVMGGSLKSINIPCPTTKRQPENALPRFSGCLCPPNNSLNLKAWAWRAFVGMGLAGF
ncbi:hypothetical protein [Kingella sp. (in: b-proteobacteria)]|uniref:hypothetical protein n=1 Tax=Kingella sp. (in: b-proteobacteria) TaxID=2020713 RepID=UPI0026DD8F02|nr:hypothetical protein [Kingella sp. (in: b-proteobacteria)]MDO4657457.1 hypothetical protein [Kingella sp. (in: b-proteobacteria)]